MSARALRPHEVVVDVLLAVLVALSSLPFHLMPPLIESSLGWLAWPAWALGVIAIAIRRWRPGVALAIVAASAGLQMAALSPPEIINLAQLMVVFSCAAAGPWTLRWVALAVAAAGSMAGGAYTVLIFGSTGGDDGASALPASELVILGIAAAAAYFLALALSWALGLVRYLFLRAREAQVARRIAEIEGAHANELVDSERERARIAREMHDVLAHSLVVIATLSDAARMSIAREPEEAEQTVRTIGEVSRDALADVRRLLAELRHEQDGAPAASYDDREELFVRFSELGLEVRRTVEGAPRPLTPGASLAAYRSLQEALTNALRHGDAGSPVRVRERWSEHALDLSVRNACRSGEPSFPSGGHGLRGLRERILLEAGQFSAGRAGGEFELAVALPVGQAAGVPRGRGLASGEPSAATTATGDDGPAPRADALREEGSPA